jgi:hypothetical protein
MAVATRNSTSRGRATKSRRRRASSTQRSVPSRSHLKRSGVVRPVKYRGAKISRARVRGLRDDLDRTRATVGALHENFWVISEQEIREMLAKTQEKIGRAVNLLQRAA